MTRDAFPLRFKNPRGREALRRVAELTGQSMTDVAERAIEHEVVLLAVDLEHRLHDALEIVGQYSAAHDLAAYLDAASAGEGDDLDLTVRAVAAHAAPQPPAAAQTDQPGSAALDVLAAFAR